MAGEDALLKVLEGVGSKGPTPSSPPAPAGGGRPTPVTRSNLFVHHDTHPVVLDLILLDKYQADWLTWEPETLWKEILEDFKAPSINDHVKTKIQAIRTLHINEWFWTRWEVFCWITQALNNNLPDFQVIQKPTVPQLFVAVDTATMVRDDEEFTAEAQMFVAASVVHAGVLYAPEPIAFCQDEIVQLLEVQNKDALELIPKVKARWEQIGKDGWELEDADVLEENPVDVQVAKLLVARKYLDLRQSQMHAQLKAIR